MTQTVGVASPQNNKADAKPYRLIDQINDARNNLTFLAEQILMVNRIAYNIKLPEGLEVSSYDLDFITQAPPFDTYTNPSNNGTDIASGLKDINYRISQMRGILEDTIKHFDTII